jgi:hypothetical protein
MTPPSSTVAALERKTAPGRSTNATAARRTGNRDDGQLVEKPKATKSHARSVALDAWGPACRRRSLAPHGAGRCDRHDDEAGKGGEAEDCEVKAGARHGDLPFSVCRLIRHAGQNVERPDAAHSDGPHRTARA